MRERDEGYWMVGSVVVVVGGAVCVYVCVCVCSYVFFRFSSHMIDSASGVLDSKQKSKNPKLNDRRISIRLE